MILILSFLIFVLLFYGKRYFVTLLHRVVLYFKVLDCTGDLLSSIPNR